MPDPKTNPEQRLFTIQRQFIHYKAYKSLITSENSEVLGEGEDMERDSFLDTGTKGREHLELKVEQTLRKTF